MKETTRYHLSLSPVLGLWILDTSSEGAILCISGRIIPKNPSLTSTTIYRILHRLELHFLYLQQFYKMKNIFIFRIVLDFTF